MENAVLILYNDFEAHLRMVLPNLHEILDDEDVTKDEHEGYNVYMFGNYEMDMARDAPLRTELDAHREQFKEIPSDIKYSLVCYDRAVGHEGNIYKHDVEMKLTIHHKPTKKLIFEDHNVL
jgi:hypothetical protein